MQEAIVIKLKLDRSGYQANKADVDKLFGKQNMLSNNILDLEYTLYASYLGDLAANLKIMSRLTKETNLHATHKIRMLLTDVLQELNAL